MTIRIDGTNTAANPGITGSDTDTGLQFGTDEVNIVTGGSTRATVDSSGRLLVGASSAVQTNTSANLQLVHSSGPQFIFARNDTTTITNEDIGLIRFYGNDSDGNYDECARIAVEAESAHTSTSKPTYMRFLTTPSGASSPTERMRITASGDVTTTGTSTFSRVNPGFTARNGDSVSITRNGGTPLEVNRGTNDGTLVQWFAQNQLEGNISVSGSTVSYNGAHLARWSQLPGGVERTEILRGSVLSNIDEMCKWVYDAEPEVLWAEGDELPEGVSVGDVKTPAKAAGTEENEQLNRMKVSDVEGDKNVAGVFQAWDDDDDTYTNDFYCAMTGDFVIRIAEGVTVERGDLLMSAGDGTAKPQDDDIIRSKTIAKVTSTNVSCTYDDGSYCVPCVLMAC